MSKIPMCSVCTWCNECGAVLPRSNAQIIVCEGCGTEYEIYKGPEIPAGLPRGTPMRARIGSNFPLTCAYVIEETELVEEAQDGAECQV